MAPLAVCMKSILLIIIILSNASSIDGNSSSYNSSVEFNIDGNFKEELLNSSTTEYELSEITSTPGYTITQPPGTDVPTPGTDVSPPGTDVSPPGTDVPLTVPEPLPLSGRLPTGVPQGNDIATNLLQHSWSFRDGAGVKYSGRTLFILTCGHLVGFTL